MIKSREIEIFCLESVAKMTEYLRINYDNPDFDVRVRLDFSPYRTRSWGGQRNNRNFISLALNRYTIASLSDKPIDFKEYSSFSYHPIIGDVNNVHWKKALLALIAHELAHAAQFSDVGSNVVAASNLSNKDKSGHGFVWKKIYQSLRIYFVNTVNFDRSDFCGKGN